MVNQSVNKFYTRLLFKIESPPQDVVLILDIDATFFNNLSPSIRELFISEGVQVHLMLPTDSNQQVNQRLLLVRNEALDAKNNNTTIGEALQPEDGS